MKRTLVLIAIAVLASAPQAWAGPLALEDDALETVSSGTLMNDALQTIPAEVVSKVVNDDVIAGNNVNISDTHVVNDIIDDDSVSVLILKDKAQKEIKAFNVINSVRGSVGNAWNVHATRGEIHVLNQSNVIIQH